MSRKEEIYNKLITTDTSMGATFDSDVFEVQGGFCVQSVWSSGSTPVGTLTLKASLDNSTFSDISTLNVSGNSGSVMFNIEAPKYKYAKVTYTRTSGSATLNTRVRGFAD